MFLASGLSVGGGEIAGEELGGDRQAQGLSPGIWDPAGSGPTGEGTWYLGWKEVQMLPAWLTAQVPPTCSCYLCVPQPQKAQPLSFRVYFFLSGSVPPLHFQVPPGLLGPAL